MGKPPSRKQADQARPTRRSIVELTEAACRAAGDIGGGTDVSPPSWPGLSAFAQELRRGELSGRVEAEGEDRSRPSTPSLAARKQDVDAQHDEPVEAADHVGRTEPVARSATCDGPAASGETEKRDRELSHATASGTCELSASDSTADMAVKIAKAYQADTLDDIKLGFNAALDYAAEFAKGRAASDTASGVVAADCDDGVRNTLAAEYRAEAVALMETNVATSLDLARQLLNAKTSAEWIELASTHARVQCELMLQQGRALRSLARSMTISPAGQAGPRRDHAKVIQPTTRAGE
jgi:hypothetical protein